jgi:hypothetical protein
MMRLGNDLLLDFVFALTLKSRERIQASATVIVDGKITVHLFLPFTKDDRYRALIFRTFKPLAEATANRWALSLTSAEDALDDKIYEALEAELRSIKSPDFKVRWVCVNRIIPLTDSVPKPVIPPPEETRIVRTIKELSEDVNDFDVLRVWEDEQVAKRPELFTDSKYGARIRNRLTDKILSILLNRRDK